MLLAKYKEKQTMAIAIDPLEKLNYVLKCDRKLSEENQTVFFIKPLTAKEAAKIQDVSVSCDNKGEEIAIKSGTIAIRTLELGLKGWKNFKDSKGNIVEYKGNSSGRPDPISLNRLLPKYRTELTDAITDRAGVDADLKKS